MKQQAFCYTYLINVCEGFWEEDFYSRSNLELFTVLYPTIDTRVIAWVAKGIFNPN